MENIIIICLLCALVAFFVRFVNYCIGDPRVLEDGNTNVFVGRIFSFYGLWLTSKYNAHYNKQVERWNEQLSKLTNPTEAEIQAITANIKPSVYSMLGMCPVCFGTWLSLASWIAICAVFQLSFFWIIFCVPTSTILAVRIKV